MIDEIFKTPVYIESLEVNLKELKDLCLKERVKDKIGERKSNTGYQSGNINIDLYKNLFDSIFKHAEKFYKLFEVEKDLIFQNAWININGKKDVNFSHNHPGSFMSGVFYVQTPPKSGNITFENPINNFNFLSPMKFITKYNNYNACIMTLPTTEGTLLLFPSWLSHYVESNESNRERISISFNMGL